MPVNIRFDGPDCNTDRQSKGYNTPGIDIVAEGFDLDYCALTVYHKSDDGYNYMLAVPAPYMNEDGVECGEIAWKIEPEPKLLELLPKLREHVGKVFGRVIVYATTEQEA